MTNHDPIPARLAALKTTSTPGLKQQWRDLFDTEPPPLNRRYLESRLAYRIQELAYGGLKPETIRRLEALGEQLDGGNIITRHPGRPEANRRNAADPRLEGRRTDRHRDARRLRMAGAALSVAIRHRPRHHRHPVERLDILRPQEQQGDGMSKPAQPDKLIRKLRCARRKGRAGPHGARLRHPKITLSRWRRGLSCERRPRR